MYSCNCQSYSKAQVRAPEYLYKRYTTPGLKRNRQIKYPLPSVLSNKDIEGLSNDESGIIVNWATKQDRTSFKMCKQ